MTPLWYFVVTVELTTPGAVTQAGEALAGATDARVERDPYGNFWVPGTSLAGSLRAHFSDRLPDEAVVRRLLGWVQDATKGRVSQGAPASNPSLIRVLGSVVREVPRTPVVMTAQTAIARDRRAARQATLRTGEFMPAGTTVTAYVSTESEEARDALVELLPCWRPLIGRAKTNGFGQTTTTAIRWGTLDRSSRQGLRRWLEQGGPALAESVARSPLTAVPAAELDDGVQLKATIEDALLIRGEQEVSNGRTETKVLRRDGRPLVPSTTLRGVLRSQMEFILRSAGARACDDTGCGDCWGCEMFGFGGNKATGAAGRRGRMRFADASLEAYGLGTRMRNSIDRFSSGAADKRLWTEEVVENGRFPITIRPWPLPRDGVTWADAWREFSALLVLAVRDLNEGYCRIGGAVTTGHGRVTVSGLVVDDAAVADAVEILQQIVARDRSEVAS